MWTHQNTAGPNHSLTAGREERNWFPFLVGLQVCLRAQMHSEFLGTGREGETSTPHMDRPALTLGVLLQPLLASRPAVSRAQESRACAPVWLQLWFIQTRKTEHEAQT